MSHNSTDLPWVIFNLLNEHFAVSSDNVREMVAMPTIVPIPKAPDHIRGVINLRGQVIPVMDLRLRLGMPSLSEEIAELDAMLAQREQDHKNWLAELDASVREKRAFRLATDPHKCGFGIWYDNYKTNNRVLAFFLRKFDEPHKKIHAIAQTTKELVAADRSEEAFALIEQTKENELAEMIRLFRGARDLLEDSSREIALVLEIGSAVLAVSVDSVATVERFAEVNIQDMPEVTSTVANECLSGIGKRDSGKEQELVQLLKIEALAGQEEVVAAQAQAA